MGAERYRKVFAWFSSRPDAFRWLVRLNRWLPRLFYVLYPALLAALGALRDARFLRVLLVPAAAFALCTLLRRAVRAQRPCERLQIEPLIAHRGTRNSFPSRHMACAAVIAAAYGCVYPAAGFALGVLAIGIAVVRVLAGIHFPRDVAAGAALGLGVGVLGFWVL